MCGSDKVDAQSAAGSCRPFGCRSLIQTAIPVKATPSDLMDLTEVISDLHLELEQIDQAIRSLERLAISHPKRRGRPPKWMAEIIKAKDGADSKPSMAAKR